MKEEKTVLVVDDEDMVRNFVAKILREAGYEVLTASSGADAWTIAGQQGDALDLVVTDIRMPQMNGRVLAHGLRQACPRAKVVFISGYPGEFMNDEGEFETQVEFLAKPFSAERLLEKVRSHLAPALP